MNRNLRSVAREEELLGLMQEALLVAYSEALDEDQTVVGVQLILIDEQILGEETVILVIEIEGTVFFAPGVTNLPTKEELDRITAEALESEEFLRALQNANDPLLSQTTQVQVQTVSTAPTLSPSEGSSGIDATRIVLITVAALALVSAAVLGYFIVIRPRRANSSMDSGSPRSELSVANIGLLEKEAGVVVMSDPTALSVVSEEQDLDFPASPEEEGAIMIGAPVASVGDTADESQSKAAAEKAFLLGKSMD